MITAPLFACLFSIISSLHAILVLSSPINSSQALREETTVKRLACQPPIRTPSDSIGGWFFESKTNGPHYCFQRDLSDAPWVMLSAYRAGGVEGVHWKYMDKDFDWACLANWKYYSEDGETLLLVVPGQSTTYGASRKWCALKVYRSGGVQGKQWERCLCSPFVA